MLVSSSPPEEKAVDRPTVADYPAGAHMPTRVIDDFELVWMLRGRARLVTADDEIALSPGQLLLLPPALAHSLTWDPTRPSRHGYLHFAAEQLTGDLPRQVLVRPMTHHDPLAGLCAYLLWLGRRDHDDWHRQVRETLRFLLAVFVSGSLPEADAAPALPPPLAGAVDHLRLEWSELPLRRIGVEELSQAALVSRGYLNRLFQGAFGHGPAPAMEHARCSRTEMLLTRTDLTVEVIALQCGFADLSHFSHRFTALDGVAPRGYRAAVTPEASVLDDPGVRRLARLLW
jgi:AraC-like DNA-binding protein